MPHFTPICQKYVYVWGTGENAPTPIFHLKGTVSQELRWVLIYINRKFFSTAIVGHHKILIFIKGTLHNQQKKIQSMIGPTILDAAITIAGRIFYQRTS